MYQFLEHFIIMIRLTRRQTKRGRSLRGPFTAISPTSVRCNVFLLFTSYRFVKGLLAITFYYLLFLAETFMMCVNIFFYIQEHNFSLIRHKTKIFPIDPHYKKFSIFVGSNRNFVSGLIKNVDTQNESFS